MSPEIITKLGCYSHSSDFGLGGSWGLPGIHWNKNYICHQIRVTPPAKKTSQIVYNCPTCNQNIKIKIPSTQYGNRKRILNGMLGLFTIIFIIDLLTFNFKEYKLDAGQILTIKIWGTIIGIFVGFIFISNSYSNWFCYYPRISKDFHFSFFKHKFFHD